MAFQPVRKIYQEPGSCALFGAISFSGKNLSGQLAVNGISEAESARCGDGSGVLFGDTQRGRRGKIISVSARDACFVEDMRGALLREGISVSEFMRAGNGNIYEATPGMRVTRGGGNIYEAVTEAEYLPLVSAVVAANAAIAGDDAHIISFGHGLRLFKGVEKIRDIDNHYGISGMSAPAILAHGKYSTGPGPKDRRAHPFSFGNVGIVHNGDVTSFHANLAACEAKLAELYHASGGKDVAGFLSNLRKSWVGTDSEVIGAVIYTLLKLGLMSEPGLSVPSIMDALVPHFDNSLTRLLRGSAERERLDSMAIKYKGFALDGPVSSIALITYEDDVHLVAFRDRNTFRPLQIVIDHENGVAYAASELRQIVAATGVDISSHRVESFSPDPGKFLWVSSKSGIITPGRKHRPFIVLPNPANDIEELKGTPHQFAGHRINTHKIYRGILGTFGGSYADGSGTFELFGCMQDNNFEASSLDTVICHGNASMMLANAYQGRRFFLRGSLDSRGFQQLRPNPKTGEEPTAIIGETAGQYLGKMASAGVIMALGLQHLGKEDIDTPIVGDFTGTGMVGTARIFVRGYLIDDYIKRPPSRRDVIAVCRSLMDEGFITDARLHDIRHDALNFPRLKDIIKDPGAISRLEHLFDPTLVVERRSLNQRELAELTPHLEEYFRVFGLSDEWLNRVLKSGYTIISVAKNQKAKKEPAPDDSPKGTAADLAKAA
ncbi:hypothetical protein HY988_06755 [Candidatus Micrarchaeota archaeon]|nr:hypothetical protein [Candidatus Micrarchaeota archaeon]